MRTAASPATALPTTLSPRMSSLSVVIVTDGCTRSDRSIAVRRRSSSNEERTWRAVNTPMMAANSRRIAKVRPAEVRARRQRIGRRCSRVIGLLNPDHVASAAHGVEDARLAAGLELAAQVRDEYVDGVRLGERRVAPDIVEQGLARHHQTLVAHQVLEQLELARRQVDATLAAEDLARVRVEAQVGDDERSAAARRPAPQQRAPPGQQLLALERLDEVVVGARVEPTHAVLERVAGGEHEDRDVAAVAQPARHLDAVEARQAEVEHNGVGLEHRRLLERGHSVLGQLHVIALEPQRATQRPRNLGVVLDYEHSGSWAHAVNGRPNGAPHPGLYRTFSDVAGGFVSMARVNRAVCLLLALAFACLGAAPAHAFTAAEGRAAADGAAIAWGRDHQQKDGAIVDYVAERPTYGYATLMMGYGLIRAGVRHHDPESVRRGFSAVDAALKLNNPHRGVFDALANATAYSWVARNLPDDPSFLALRARWERYLTTIAQPYIGSSNLKRCTVDPVCFHNHEAVGAFGDLQLLRTRLHSRVRGAKLADYGALRAAAVHRLPPPVPPPAPGGGGGFFRGARR